MDYEYVALVDQPRHGLYWDELVAEEWCEWMKIPFWTRPDRCGPEPSYVYIMRRPKKEETMNLSDEQITEVFGLLHQASSEQRKDFLARLSFLDFNERQQLYDMSWADQIADAPAKGGKMNNKKECVEETCTYEKTLLVLSIYNAYLRKTCYDSEQALRLTFIEVQHYMGRALTWPNK